MPATTAPHSDALRAHELESGIDSHSLSYEEYSAIEKYRPPAVNISLETGTGKSSVLFSNFSKKHFIFTFDDSVFPEGNVNYTKNNPIFLEKNCEFVFGPTQKTLFLFNMYFQEKLDYVFLDGPHGFPLVHLEYYNICAHLRPGSILAMDDLTIPNIRELFINLAEDDAFELIDIVGEKVGFLRRTEYPIEANIANDLWYEQRHNKIGYSALPGHAAYNIFGKNLIGREGIFFGASGNSDKFKYHGWSYAEAEGSWSDGSECSITFLMVVANASAGLDILYRAIGETEVILDGTVVTRLPESVELTTRTIPLQFVELGRNAHILILRPSKTHSDPGRHFLDERKLGIFVSKIAPTLT